MTGWLRHHLHSLAATARRFAAQPFDTLINALVIGVALALPLGGYALLANIQSLAHGITVSAQVSVFLAMDASAADRESLEKRLRAEPGVREARFVSRAAALDELRQRAGLGDIVATLRDNPLPDAFVLTLAENDADLADRLAASLRALPKVAYVQLDSAWVRRVDALLRLSRTAIAILATLLAIALVAVTFNTIRLQILTQREEIVVSKLVGATNAFIRRPFYYCGGLQGALGGLLALLLVRGALALLDRDVSTLATLYGSGFRLGYLTALDSLAFLAFAAALGWLGAWMSVSKHLWQIEPR